MVHYMFCMFFFRPAGRKKNIQKQKSVCLRKSYVLSTSYAWIGCFFVTQGEKTTDKSQNRQIVFPSSSMSIFWADGIAPRPGMVIIVPASG
jgi:hypothetical protein